MSIFAKSSAPRSWYQRFWKSRLVRPVVAARLPLCVECLEDRNLMSITVSGGFDGLAFDPLAGATPPDTQVAVGPTAIGEAVNTSLEFFNKSGTSLFQGTFASLFGPLRVDGNDNTLMSDPSIHYDADKGRFIVSILDLDLTTNKAYLDVAFSTNNHPAQPSDFYGGQLNVTETARSGSPNAGSTLWTDFDRYGSSANAYVFTFNMFTFPISSQSLYDHVQILAISKSAILAANPSFVTHTVDLSGWNGSSIVNENLSPADMHGAAATDPMYFVEEASYGSASNTQLRVLKVANILTAAASDFQAFNITVPTYTTNPVVDSAHPWNSGDVNANAPQLGTADQMQTNDTRVLSVAWRRDTQGVEHLVATQDVGATLARARWYEFDTSTSTPTLRQSGDLGPAGASAYMASIDVTPNGTIGVNYLESSSTEYMSMYVAGRLASDPLNTMQAAALAQPGLTGYTLSGGESSPHRTGDFSGIGVDIDSSGNPLNAFWAANEYTGSNAAWATHISNFSVTAPPIIDLNWNGGGISGPATANWQTSFTISRTYTITGANAPNSFTIAYYASPDATFGTSNQFLLGTETISAAADLAMGSHTGTSPSFLITTGGTYYLYAVLDSTNAIAETNESNNQAQASQPVLVSGPVLVDNGQPGYSETGTGWADWSAGYNGDLHYHAAGTGADTASWQASGLPAGYYTIEATWNGASNHASNAPYAIYDGTTLVTTVLVNQQPAPSGSVTLGGVVFQDLVSVKITSGTIRVVLSDNANGFVVADAVRFLPIPAPVIDLNWVGGGISGPTAIGAQTPFNIGRNYTITGAAASTRFTIAYYASPDTNFADGTLLGTETISAAGDLAVGSHGGTSPSFVLNNGGTYYLFAQLDSGNAILETDETNNITMASQPVVVMAPAIVDNGQPGYSETGSGWASYGAGYNGSLRYHAAGTGADTAIWQASGLAPGYYTIQATWNGAGNHASNAPFAIYDGSTLVTTVLVNQQPNPTGSTTVGGVVFQNLVSIPINSGTIQIVLSDNANGFVVADAVRIVPIPAPVVDLNWVGGGLTGPTTATTGTAFTLTRTYTITGAAAPSSFTIAYYASPDTNFADGTLLGTETISAAGDLAVGTHSGTSPNLTLSSGGTYYLFAQLDSTNNILETNKSNNVAMAPQPVVVAGAVLVDNGQPGYSETGTGWADWAAGYNGDLHYHAAGTGADTAIWQASGLPAGYYTIQATWNSAANHASNAPYSIYDGTTLVATVLVNQQSAPSGSTTLGGVVFQNLVSVPIMSGTVSVVLSDNANGFVVADAVRFLPIPAPVVDLNWVGGGISGPATGSVQTPFTLSRSYTITGAAAPSSFTIAYYASPDTNFADGVLVGTETMSAAADLAVGTHSGTSPSLVINNPGTYYLFAQLDSTNNILETNKANNVAMAPQALVVTGPVIVDNGGPGYSETGTGWAGWAAGYNGSLRYHAARTGADTAVWQATGLPAGYYTIQATWNGAANHASNAPYSIYDGTTLVATVLVNQQPAPSGTTVGGVLFQNLASVPINSGTIRVVLSDNANGFVVADAVQIVPIPAPVIDLNWVGGGLTGPAVVSTQTPFTLSRNYTITGTAATSSFTISYYASPDTNFADGTLLGTETISAATDLAVGSHSGNSPSFTLNNTGTYYLFAQLDSGNVILETNETNNVTMAAQPILITAPVIVDNGQPGYSETGPGWQDWAAGYNGDLHYHAAGTGADTAIWQATGLPAGYYTVLATWNSSSNHASNAPYSIYDGSTLVTTVLVNQQPNPTGSTVNGIPFQTLATVQITSGTLRVVLSDNANGFVVADAVELVAVPPPATGHLASFIPLPGSGTASDSGTSTPTGFRQLPPHSHHHSGSEDALHHGRGSTNGHPLRPAHRSKPTSRDQDAFWSLFAQQ
jgi:subtilase family serine protease